MKIEVCTREFLYNGVRLPDPNPRMTVEEVRATYASVYPDIATASVDGPEPVGDKMRYTFTRAIGSKG
jgi:PRTRC genetic system protein C